MNNRSCRPLRSSIAVRSSRRSNFLQPRIAGMMRIMPFGPDEKLSYSVTRSTPSCLSRKSVKWLPMNPPRRQSGIASLSFHHSHSHHLAQCRMA